MKPTEMQGLINSGLAWRLEGSVGREAMRMIEQGICMLGEHGNLDYWGNYVPSRDEVEAGTKGSRDFVVKRYGEEHAKELDNACSNPMKINWDEEEP